jgi:SAM-dependent methyltransferase
MSFVSSMTHLPRDISRLVRRSLNGNRASRTPAADVHDVWQRGLTHETAFWTRIITGTHKRQDWVENMRQRAADALPFLPDLAPYVAAVSADAAVVRILDVGAGPVTIIGTATAPRPVEVIAVDPLAENYAALLAKHGLVPVTKTLIGDAETLSDLKLGEFDIVFSRNALDHSYDPMRAIEQMLKACKPGGVVYLAGHVNEATSNNYSGLHQWNFMPLDNGDLVIWRKGGPAISVRAALAGKAAVNAKGHDWYRVEILPTPHR